ncbi:MAG: hypothetical protein IPK83_21005 [Planctomycetes bacterium]|nr:hypothetical protein [Planctomycetota bacterium]
MPADERARIEAHVLSCALCANELASIRALAARFAELNKPSVPNDLWDAIKYRTEGSHPSHRSGPRGLSTIRKYAIAVCAVLVVLAGGRAVSRLGQVENVASASAVDFGALLDALPTDAVGAFEKFLSQYLRAQRKPDGGKENRFALEF